MARLGRRQPFPWKLRKPPIVGTGFEGELSGTCSLSFSVIGETEQLLAVEVDGWSLDYRKKVWRVRTNPPRVVNTL